MSAFCLRKRRELSPSLSSRQPVTDFAIVHCFFFGYQELQIFMRTLTIDLVLLCGCRRVLPPRFATRLMPFQYADSSKVDLVKGTDATYTVPESP